MLVLPATLTLEQASACVRMLGLGLRAQPGQQVVVDAGSLTQFDSSALAVLLECRREALASGKRFAVKDMPARLLSLATLYGVAELLPAQAKPALV
ncbi:MAG: lipid asymmetry maintenance protein MlaB [Burkholderiaceae bacterium]